MDPQARNPIDPAQINVRIEKLCGGDTSAWPNIPHYNCFGALLYATGLQTEPTSPLSMREIGERIALDEAVKRFTTPFVFQLCGPYGVPDEMGGWESLHGVIHTGLVLGLRGMDGTVEVFEKVGPTGPARKGTWKETIEFYFKNPPLADEYCLFTSVEGFRTEYSKRW